jgi:cytochrome oxidase Cu insertion factor (SCO1/SenC/PrrC family)
MQSLRRGSRSSYSCSSGVPAAGCGSHSRPRGATTPGATFEGLAIQPPKPAPALALNYAGQPVKLSTFRGKAVLVTFVYTHCPDVCPLIVANLAAAQRQLGSEARHLQVIAVTVDPEHDTRRAVQQFLFARGALRADGLSDREPQAAIAGLEGVGRRRHSEQIRGHRGAQRGGVRHHAFG